MGSKHIASQAQKTLPIIKVLEWLLRNNSLEDGTIKIIVENIRNFLSSTDDETKYLYGI